jgi:hypothetical protein
MDAPPFTSQSIRKKVEPAQDLAEPVEDEEAQAPVQAVEVLALPVLRPQVRLQLPEEERVVAVPVPVLVLVGSVVVVTHLQLRRVVARPFRAWT